LKRTSETYGSSIKLFGLTGNSVQLASGSLHHFKDSLTVVCNSSSGKPFLVHSCVKIFIALDAGDGIPSTGINDMHNPALLHILTLAFMR
jgi:hypothetical protein